VAAAPAPLGPGPSLPEATTIGQGDSDAKGTVENVVLDFEEQANKNKTTTNICSCFGISMSGGPLTPRN